MMLRARTSRVRRAAGGTTSVGPCVICGESPVVLYLLARSDHIPLRYRITEEHLATCWDLWRCRQCHLIFSDWQLTEEELQQLYRGMRDELYDQEDASRRLAFRNNLAFIARFLHGVDTGSVSLLDVGCATGLFLLEARERGWMVEGIDICPWAVERAHQRGIPLVHEGTVFSYLGAPGRFDVVSLLDYIEHDPNPALLLDRLHAFLKPSGLLYLTTPDIGGITARLLGSRWWGINPLHLTYFSRKTMRLLLEQHGFEVIASRFYTRTFTFGYWASRLEHFHPLLARMAMGFFDILRLSHVRLPLNLFDAMEVLARKK